VSLALAACRHACTAPRLALRSRRVLFVRVRGADALMDDWGCARARVSALALRTLRPPSRLTAENPSWQLSQLPQGAVTIRAPADNLHTNTCYEEFSLDLSSVGGPADPIALSTKYTSLGQCAPAIAGAGWVQSTDYDNDQCSDTPAATPPHRLLQGAAGPAPPPAGKGRGGAGGDASNKVAVQFGICYMDPDFMNLVDDPTTAFDETTIGDYLPAYAKVDCNADGTITQKQYFDPNCRGAEADAGTTVRELLEATLEAEIQQDTGLPPAVYQQFLGAVDDYIVLPDDIPDTFSNGQCVVTAVVSLSQLTGDPADDTTQATKWEYGGCVAATVGVAGVGSQDYGSLNCREGTEMGEQGNPIATPREEIQFDVCQENPSLDNLIDDPDTPFDETSVGRYMPGYLKYHCNDDATITIRHYHEPTCMGHEADYGASLQHLMNAVFTQDFDTSLDDMTDDGAVIQFTYPHKFKNGQCYPIMQLDLSNLQGGAKDPINLATKYHFRGCPAPGGGGGDTPGTGGGDTPPPPPAATCDEHMVTVLSAQVTTACCPQFDPNCGIPDTCSPRCAPVFNNFYDSCQSFIDGVELAAFRDKCTAAGGAAGGGGRGGR
jgi:hypothetical protein